MGRRLYVNICHAKDLMPRDGQGSASAYCIVSFDGQRQGETGVKHKDLNPVWNYNFHFEISDDALADKYLEVSVYNKSSRTGQKDASLGRVKIQGKSILKGPHEQTTIQELKGRNFFSSVKGELKLVVWWSDDESHTPPAYQQLRSVVRPSAPQSEILNDVVTTSTSTFTAESSSKIHKSLLEASNMIRQISRSARKAKVNFRQCNLLSLVCKLGDVSIEMWKVAKLKDCAMAVSQLLWVLKRAQKFVDDCSNENWQWLAAVKFDRKCEVAAILEELMMCVEILNLLAMKYNDEGWMMDLLNGDIDMEGMIDLNCLEKCVNEDQKQRAEKISNAAIAGYMLKRQILPPQLPELKPDEVKVFYQNRLGGGTYGDVYEGKWLGKPVAVKVLKGIQHFEVEFISGLPYSSPHILQSIGYYDSSGRTHMVMELMRMDLLSFIRLKKTPLPLILLIDIILQIAKGIEYLHENNIAHRDLKPENILVDFEDTDDAHCIIKLVDFGTSKLNFDSVASYNTSPVGTMMYMAPELLKGNVSYGKSVELYSFGVICSVLLTGVVPFSNINTRSELYASLKKGQRPGLPPDCPSILSALIHDCWRFEPLERPSIFQVADILRGLKASILRGE